MNAGRRKGHKTPIVQVNTTWTPGRQRLHWDTALTGFGVLASGKTAAKTYVVQREVDGRSRRVTVDPSDDAGDGGGNSNRSEPGKPDH